MKLNRVVASCLLACAFLSCSKDEDPIILNPPVVTINEPAGGFALLQGDSVLISAKINSVTPATYQWAVSGVDTSTDSTLWFKSKDLGEFPISLTITNVDGVVKSEIKLTVHGKYKYGTFILNEGSAFQENGFLTFIDPKGNVTDSVYYKVNGSSIGNVTQDLFKHDGRFYIIAQNGKNGDKVGVADGTLVIANSETLKREAVFNTELATLGWPTHVAVLSPEQVYIRDNNGISVFNTVTKTLIAVKDTKGAAKKPMVVIGDKVYACSAKNLLVMQAGKDSILQKVEMPAAISSITSADGNLWLSSAKFIAKIDPKDYTIIKQNPVTELSVAQITAKGDTLYCRTGTSIYRHVFATGETKLMVDVKTVVSENVGMVYGPLAVHPQTGDVYVTTIKGFGLNFLLNNISVFNFANTTTPLKVNYKDHVHFPAGVYFNY